MCVAIIVALAAAAVATGLIRFGSPVKPHRTLVPTRTSGIGLPIPGSSHLLAVSVADPHGGPSWGMRVFQTTRGLECVQVGRLNGGRLGALGQDGLYGNDRLFHELPPGVIGLASDCSQLDSHGHAFLAERAVAFPASGWLGTCRTTGQGPFGRYGEVGICPDADLRELDYGLLGPKARRLSYLSGRTRTDVSPAGAAGAYLIVLPAGPTALRAGGLLPSLLPGFGSPITNIDYAGGLSCQVPAVGGSICAQPPGRVGRAGSPSGTAGDVRSAIHLSIRPSTGHPTLEISFVVRRAVTDARHAYLAQVAISGRGPCRENLRALTDRNLAAGQTTTIAVALYAKAGRVVCPGLYRVSVAYVALATANPGPTGPDAGALPVGRTDLRVR